MSPTPHLSDVRASCARVAPIADHVSVVGDPGAYARSFDLPHIRAPTWDTVHHYRGGPAETVSYVLALDAVNFGSGWFPSLHKRPGMSGYFTIASRLTDLFEREGPLGAERLAQMTAEDTAAIFDQPLEVHPVAELMEHFAEAWRQLGALLLGRFEGAATRLVEAAEGRAKTLVEILVSMPYFQDVATYRGRRVSFYKRAQITVSDLDLALSGEGWGRFEDLDELTIFADNLVPHVLRVDGLLAYDDELSERIASGEPLEPGSAEEVEIRAAAVDAVERMVAELRSDDVEATARAFDVAIWNCGQLPRYRQTARHRTRTVYY